MADTFFFFSSDDVSHEDRVRAVADRFYVERTTAHAKKTRAVRRLASALMWSGFGSAFRDTFLPQESHAHTHAYEHDTSHNEKHTQPQQTPTKPQQHSLRSTCCNHH